MNLFKRAAALVAVLFLLVHPVAAQWQTPIHSVPVGRGAGVTGFGSAMPGAAGIPLTSQGSTVDPAFGPIGNNGLANAPADTVKCNPTASTGAVQDCTPAQVSNFVGSPFFATRTAAAAATIGPTVSALYVNGYAAAVDGGAGSYLKLAAAPSPVKAWQFQSTDGAWWQLAASPVLPKQLGAKLDGVTDDALALQAWHDYGVTFGVTSAGQFGTAAIPTETVNLLSGANIDGRGLLTVQRTTNINASLFDCNIANSAPQTGITVRGMTFTTTSGFSGSGSNTIGLTSQSYTVPAGLGIVPGSNTFVQITASPNTAARINYEIAQVTAYSGTTLTVTGTTINGSGTFSNWLIDLYPQNGDLSLSNIALRFTNCSNVIVDHNTISGRFYNGLDSRNGTDVWFSNNLISGHVNRGIHMAAYLVGNSAANNQALSNHIVGNNFSQYGINTSASDGATASRFDITNNQIDSVNFQGIIIAGGITFSNISGNTAILQLQTNGAGIIVEGLTGTSGLQVPQHITVVGNNLDFGNFGIFVQDTFYSTFSANTISGAAIGLLLNGPTAGSVQYVTVNGNIIQGGTSHGLQLTGGAAGGVNGSSIIGNVLIGNAGTGLISNSLTSNNNYGGNVSLTNGTAYSIAGSGNVITGANL